MSKSRTFQRFQFLRTLVLSMFSMVAATPAEVRSSKDINGRILKGEFIFATGGNISIKKENGQVFTLKASAFSTADQKNDVRLQILDKTS